MANSSAPGQAASAPGVRMISAGVEASVERFSDPQLLAEGRANIISLETVRQRLGARWALRRDQVYGFTDRVLERGIGGEGVYLRVSDTDFFIVHPELGRVAGQAACLRYLREILNHFLGDDEMAAASVLQVTCIADGRMEAQPMEPRAALGDLEIGLSGEGAEPASFAEAAPRPHAGVEPERRLPPSRAKPPPSAAADDGGSELNRWTPFVCNDGRSLRVSATLEPVYELKGFTRIGFRMIRRVIVVHTEEELSREQVAALSAPDLLRIDVATILRGIDRLKADVGREETLSLIVPVSFVSLASQRGRAELVTHLKAAGALVRMGVICEICHTEGVPPGMLLAAVSLVRPFSLLVAGRVEAARPTAIGQLAGAGLKALSFECPKGLADAEFGVWAAAIVASAKRIAKSVLVYGAASPARAGSLASLGATHVSMAAA